MKKILSAVLAAATLSTAVPAIAADSGSWYAGLQLGAAFNRTKFTASATGSPTESKSKSKVSAPIGLQMGWMYGLPNNFFFAAEVGALYNIAGETKLGEINSGGVTSAQKFTKRWSLEFMPKLGYQFNNDWAVYALAGLMGTSFKANTVLGNKEKFIFGFAPGLGVMYKVDSQWSTNLEYKYEIYQKFEQTGTVAAVATTIKAEPRAHVITAKINYAFA